MVFRIASILGLVVWGLSLDLWAAEASALECRDDRTQEFNQAIGTLKARMQDSVSDWSPVLPVQVKRLRENYPEIPEATFQRMEALVQEERDLGYRLKEDVLTEAEKSSIQEQIDKKREERAKQRHELGDLARHRFFEGTVKRPLSNGELRDHLLTLLNAFERDNADLIRTHLMRPFDPGMVDESGELVCYQTPDQGEGFYYYLLHLLSRDEEGHEGEIPSRGARFIKQHPLGLQIDQPSFYKSGINPYLLEMEKEKIAQGPFCAIDKNPRDIYRIRDLLCAFELKKTDVDRPILLTQNAKDGHGTLLLHVLDLETHRVIASFFLNSWKDPPYTQYMEKRFNNGRTMNNYYAQPIDDLEDVKRRFSEEELKKGLIPPTEFWPSHQLRFNWDIPLFDCSFELQHTPNDFNCALYGLNYMKGLVEMLHDPRVVAQALDTARTLKGDLTHEGALGTMKDLFQERVKAYLPMYYTESGERRADGAIKLHHLEQRWNLGSEWLVRYLSGTGKT